MNRNQRAEIAQHTLNIIKDGGYVNTEGEEINLDEQINYAVDNSRLYTPDMLEELESRVNKTKTEPGNRQTTIEVNNETTLEAAHRLKTGGEYRKVACLNFASAQNPGGGFLKGSGAQEESLARSSALYPCIRQMDEYYQANRGYDSALYLNYMIYSPEVPVFRNDQGQLLNKPYQVSFITAPAVNAGVVRQRESQENIDKIEETMNYRIEKILSLALIHRQQALVLGAFGCGVFQNDPEMVAQQFTQYIHKDERFKDNFSKIVFAVLDHSRDKQTYKIFNRMLLKQD